MTLIRKQVFIDREANRRLKQAAPARGVSEAELIRQGIANGWLRRSREAIRIGAKRSAPRSTPSRPVSSTDWPSASPKIAAAAELNALKLATLNVKHFPMLKGVKRAY